MIKEKKPLHFLGIILLYFLFLGLKPIPNTGEYLLSNIPNIDSIIRIDGCSAFSETWEIWFSQPIDHENPNSEKFPQKVIYYHKDFNKPMVVVLEGYGLFSMGPVEPTKLLDANQICIEHRFFNSSKPRDYIPWEFLTINQVATDQHKIIQAFKPFYKGKWISTGISKGGQTTIYHRYFYPNDVDVSIPYVAPLNFSNEDKRMYSFLRNVGSVECRRKIKNYQKELFKRKSKLMPLVKEYVNKKSYSFEVGLDRAYDLNVLEYSFAFWQWSGLKCDNIPETCADDKTIFEHWIKVTPFDFFDEKSIETFRPFFYQAMTEIGMYGYEVSPWKNFISDTTNITFDFTMPKGYRPIFNSESMQKVNSWLQEYGNNILYIYGEYDPWSASAVTPSSQTNAKIFINPEGDHTTRINSFPQNIRDSIIYTLEDWLEIPIEIDYSN